MRRTTAAIALCFAVAMAAGCGGSEDLGDPFFPPDYAATYTEVRNCRLSIEHSQVRVRVLADPAALEPYQGRVDPFPLGAVVIKEEYEYPDEACAGDLFQWTVMKKLGPGEGPDGLGWTWQTVHSDGTVKDLDDETCSGCHADCTPEEDGYDSTCTVPP